MRKIIDWFDKLEDNIRGRLSHYPIAYSILGGAFVVLFWRSVWETADILMRAHYVFSWFFNPVVQLIVSTVVLMLTGLMVSVFIGDRIILSGLKHGKKLTEITEAHIREEEDILLDIEKKILEIEKKVEKLIK